MQVSSARITSNVCVLFLVLAAGMAKAAPQAGSGQGPATDPAAVFQQGQDALAHGRLDEAESDFRQVLAVDPKSGGAFANLGVVYMRRKQWTRALEMLHEAERLMPQVAGIRLNIGLAYYRQNEFLKAIPPFESVVRDEPRAEQPRYLLGLCYFFVERWADAATTLEPLWGQESGKVPYLYVLSNAAHRAGKKDLDERAAAQLIKVGDGSAQYHLFVGKYHLNRAEYDQALAEFEAAEEKDPKLPFVHFNLGWTYVKKQDYVHAREEFLKDAALEPDVALNYEQLGDLYLQRQDNRNAERSYREALRRDGRLVNSLVGLAKIYQRRQNYAAALAETDVALKIDPDRSDVHYLRGQVLLRMGRKVEAHKELQAAVRINNGESSRSGKARESGSVPSPELLQDVQ